MNVHEETAASEKGKLAFNEITVIKRIVVEGFASDQDFLMFAPRGSGKSLVFHAVPFENISFKNSRKIGP